MQNKKTFEIILYVGQITNLQIWVATKSSHGQTLINECFIFDYPSKTKNYRGFTLVAMATKFPWQQGMRLMPIVPTNLCIS